VVRLDGEGAGMLLIRATPKNVLIWLPLCVPEIRRLCTANRNRAASGCALTASSVANGLAVSTPLRRDGAAAVLTDTPPGLA
jgi:hypothetical protein